MQNTTQLNTNPNTAIINLTALWAFSEGFLGGILNAVKIPFKGLFLGSVSVIIITLIASYTDKKGIILRTGVIVMIVKAILSPYASVPAYFAVFIQTLLGELFFLGRNIPAVSAVLLGTFTSVISSVQRIIVLTLVFGNEFWKTVDQFGAYVNGEFFGGKTDAGNVSISSWLIGIYIGLHFIVGFVVGLYASRLAVKIREEKFEIEKFSTFVKKTQNKDSPVFSKNKKRQSRFLKISKLFLYIFLFCVLLLSYILKDSYFDSKSIWVMITRSLVITILWFKLISPVIRNILQKRLLKKKNKYSSEVENVMRLFPFLKEMILFSWKESSVKKGIGRISSFVSILLTTLLNYNFSEDIFIGTEQSVSGDVVKTET